MQPNDRVIRAAFWEDGRVAKLSVGAKLLYVFLISMADQDGIAPIEHERIMSCVGLSNPSQVTNHLQSVASAGLCMAYNANGSDWVWIPTLKGHQPSSGALKPQRDTTRPAPPTEAVSRLLSIRLGRVPKDSECKAASPRTYGMKRPPKGLAPSGGDMKQVWDKWVSYQKNAAGLNPSLAKETINKALKYITAEDACLLIEYINEANEPGPLFMRGENRAGRTYLGLENILVKSKIASRLVLAKDWKINKTKSGADTGVDFGPNVTNQQRKRLTNQWANNWGNGKVQENNT